MYADDPHAGARDRLRSVCGLRDGRQTCLIGNYTVHPPTPHKGYHTRSLGALAQRK